MNAARPVTIAPVYVPAGRDQSLTGEKSDSAYLQQNSQILHEQEKLESQSNLHNVTMLTKLTAPTINITANKHCGSCFQPRKMV